MRKKIALMLSILMLAPVMLCGCGTKPDAKTYNGYTDTDLLQEIYMNVQIVEGLSLDMAGNNLTVEDLHSHNYSSIYDYLISNGLTDEQINATTAWNEICDQFGTATSVDEDSFTVTKAGKTLTTDITLLFTAEDGSTKDIIFEIVYDYNSMNVTGISINPVYSMGEKLATAGLNTLISMSIVFIVLILISLLIYAFRLFPYLEQRSREKKAEEEKRQAPAADVVSQIELREEQQNAMDDLELVAVIAAAVAAGEGTSTSDFVVRSINRR